MTLKEAIESGKPFRRESWVMNDKYWNWLVIEKETRGGTPELYDIPYWQEHDEDDNQYEFSIDDILATDWILKYKCEECKDTKKVVYFTCDWMGRNSSTAEIPCPKCSAPKYKCETCKDTGKVYNWYIKGNDPCHHCSTTKKEPEINNPKSDILESPCVFCGYNGDWYWRTHTHEKSCPWYKIGGEVERKSQLRDIIHTHKKVLDAYEVKKENKIVGRCGYCKDCNNYYNCAFRKEMIEVKRQWLVPPNRFGCIDFQPQQVKEEPKMNNPKTDMQAPIGVHICHNCHMPHPAGEHHSCKITPLNIIKGGYCKDCYSSDYCWIVKGVRSLPSLGGANFGCTAFESKEVKEEPKPALPKTKKITVYRALLLYGNGNYRYSDFSPTPEDWELGKTYPDSFKCVKIEQEVIEVLDEEAQK
jgi:hypothetical protein